MWGKALFPPKLCPDLNLRPVRNLKDGNSQISMSFLALANAPGFDKGEFLV